MYCTQDINVTPLAGVWVEIAKIWNSRKYVEVTPLAGVWVEITIKKRFDGGHFVTPLAGVWVEIFLADICLTFALCHSPCGSVG